MSEIILRLSNISKKIGDNYLLKDIDLEFYKGEIHAILGENGAGKSTLVKILSGVYKKDSGGIFFEGSKVDLDSPADSLSLGIYTLQQDLFLFDHFTVAENVLIHNLPSKNKILKIISQTDLYRNAQKILDELNFPIKSNTVVGTLNLAQKRMVELAKIFNLNLKLIILDEPISSFTDVECESIYNMLNVLKSKGVSIVYISQRFSDIFKVSDKITVLRGGQITGSMTSVNPDFFKLVKMMSGDSFNDRYPKLQVKKGKEVFAVEGLCADNFLHNISFSMDKGEIVGVTGLVGSGRTKLAKTIFGLEQKSKGEIYIDRLNAKINSPKDAINLGIAYASEDRFSEGLFLNLRVLENIFLQDNINNQNPFINTKFESELFRKYAKRINLNPDVVDSEVMALSGGNQQKIMLLRWFLTFAKIFFFDEPTKGVDIPTKVDIYNMMNDLTRKGASILLISSDFDELMGMCDRILIMRDGYITADISRDEINYEKIYHYATGQ